MPRHIIASFVLSAMLACRCRQMLDILSCLDCISFQSILLCSYQFIINHINNCLILASYIPPLYFTYQASHTLFFMENQKDYLRLRSLYKQRLLEIKRQGVIVQLYHSHQILPAYLQCTFVDQKKLQSFLDSRLSLELCDLDGVPLMKIGKKSYFARKKDLYDQCRVYLDNKNAFRDMKEGPFYILVKNNATIGVLSEILNRRLEGDRYFHKIEDFIGDNQVTKIDIDQQMKLEYQQQSDLNTEQNLAIQKSFTNHLTFVKGPPGCGKTKTVSRMVKMLAEKGLKVLVGSISNIANQTLITEIVKQVNQHNYLCALYPEIGLPKISLIINYSRKALQKVSQQAKYYNLNNQLYYYILHENTSPNYNQHNIMEEIQKLQQGEKVSNVFWAIYMKSYTKLIADANIVISTTINSFKLYKYTGFRPDVGIIDEAAQASWTDTYGFLAFGVTRMVFVGDQKQLRPTVIGDATSNQILKETMFEKLSQKNPQYFVHLKTQYRMHPKIAQFSNEQIYNGLLINDQSVLQRQCSLEYFRTYPISFVTHSFAENISESTDSTDSQKGVKEFYNQYEGSLIMDFLFSVPFEEWKNIGVLTFYDMQCQVLTESLHSVVSNFDQSGLTIRTIDGYQGGQKDFILISTVRSNPQKNPGFCIQLNRVNVSLTRAKKGLIVFGDPQTLSQGKPSTDPSQNIWGKFCDFMLKKQQVLSYQQYHQLLRKSKQKQETKNRLYLLYMDSLHLMQNWDSRSIQGEDLLIKNQHIKGKAVSLMNSVEKVEQRDLKQKAIDFLKEQSPKLSRSNQNQIQELQRKGFVQVQQLNFRQKVLQIISQSFTHKQKLFASEFIYKISKEIYEIILKNHELDEFQKFFNDLRAHVDEQEHNLVDETYRTIEQWIKIKREENFQEQIESQILKKLVSTKLMYDLAILYKEKIEPEVVQEQATSSDRI